MSFGSISIKFRTSVKPGTTLQNPSPVYGTNGTLLVVIFRAMQFYAVSCQGWSLGLVTLLLCRHRGFVLIIQKLTLAYLSLAFLRWVSSSCLQQKGLWAWPAQLGPVGVSAKPERRFFRMVPDRTASSLHFAQLACRFHEPSGEPGDSMPVHADNCVYQDGTAIEPLRSELCLTGSPNWDWEENHAQFNT